MKNTYLETRFQHVETLQQQDKDYIDVLCPTYSSPKYRLLPVSRYKW